MSVIKLIKGFINRKGEKVYLPVGGEIVPYDDTELRGRIEALEGAITQKANNAHTHLESDITHLQAELLNLHRRIQLLESPQAVATYSMILPSGEKEFVNQNFLIEGDFDFVLETDEPVVMGITGDFYDTAPDGQGLVGDMTVYVRLSKGHNVISPSGLLWDAVNNSALYGHVDTLLKIDVDFESGENAQINSVVHINVFNATES